MASGVSATAPKVQVRTFRVPVWRVSGDKLVAKPDETLETDLFDRLCEMCGKDHLSHALVSRNLIAVEQEDGHDLVHKLCGKEYLERRQNAAAGATT